MLKKRQKSGKTTTNHEKRRNTVKNVLETPQSHQEFKKTAKNNNKTLKMLKLGKNSKNTVKTVKKHSKKKNLTMLKQHQKTFKNN